MTTSFDFREPSSMVYSISSCWYENLINYREGMELNEFGNSTQKDDYQLSTGRMILVEIAFIPLILLSSIETVIRGALYLVATPFIMGICIYSRKKNESVGGAILRGAMVALVLECIPLSTLTASVKGMYRNIFSDKLPSIGVSKEADRFIGNELSCGFFPYWLEHLDD